MHVKILAHNRIIKRLLRLITCWGTSVFLGSSVTEFFLKLCHIHIFQRELRIKPLRLHSVCLCPTANYLSFFRLNKRALIHEQLEVFGSKMFSQITAISPHFHFSFCNKVSGTLYFSFWQHIKPLNQENCVLVLTLLKSSQVTLGK